MRCPDKFLAKHNDSIITTLGCFDRLLFKGYLPFGGDSHLNQFVDRLNIRRKDFLPLVEPMSERLVQHAQAMCQQANAPYHYLQGKQRKEQLIDKIIRERKIETGLVAVLCVQETCRTVKLRYGKDRPKLEFAYRPQRVLYYYFLDRDFGRVHVRIQTWFPFTVQIYVNGHDWLARQMIRRKLGFTQCDNCFTAIDRPELAQQIADRFVNLAWRSRLNGWAKLVNPLLKEVKWLRGMEYRWVIDQAEFSTDVIFRSRQHLAELYPRLLDHAAVNFSAQDILTFLGRRLHGNFNGEVLTQCRKDREPGARIKHRMKENWLKMYDKGGLVLRVETVINNPREFKVRRRRTRNGQRRTVWCPMNKGIVNLGSYRQAMHASNVRYLEALSVVADPSPAYQQVTVVAQPKQVGPRRFAGFNPACRQDIQLFRAVLRGEHALHGFRNAHIRAILHPPGETPRDAQEYRRQRAAICRQLQRLHVRGLLAKIPHSRRWKVTPLGERILGKIVQLYYHGLSQAA